MLLHQLQRPEVDERKSDYAFCVVSIVLADEPDHALVLEVTAGVDIGGQILVILLDISFSPQ